MLLIPVIAQFYFWWNFRIPQFSLVHYANDNPCIQRIKYIVGLGYKVAKIIFKIFASPNMIWNCNTEAIIFSFQKLISNFSLIYDGHNNVKFNISTDNCSSLLWEKYFVTTHSPPACQSGDSLSCPCPATMSSAPLLGQQQPPRSFSVWRVENE